MAAVAWTIYLVDDEPGIMELYRHGLEVFSQYRSLLDVRILDRVDEAIAEARKHAEESSHVLWVVDSMMPWFGDEVLTGGSSDGDHIDLESDFTGLELIRRLDRLSSRIRYDYIVMTHLLGTDVEKASKVPGLRVLEKLKCSPKVLAGIIDTIISTRA